ncbi:MAG: tRNA U34 5-methylaminomethyl-2-thiouridine-forming methyltransferase MnmC [Salibacteraceae bacterium]|jgi:tRNA U34 5-methylaminomethyl-2-thiouridine-forming methyltransferase MnmC
MKLEFITTGDNSPSLYNEALNETYHSRHGARQESEHVYIKSGLNELQHLAHIRVFEMGFGTGLNILLTHGFSELHNTKIEITSIELYPLGKEIWSQLDYSVNPNEKNVFRKLQELSWEERGVVSDNMTLLKRKVGLEDIQYQNEFDIIFYDAFGPDKQPHLWTPAIFSKLYNLLDKNGVFVTYSAKGQVRRDLVSAGFEVERIQGPPGKREMLRARKK